MDNPNNVMEFINCYEDKCGSVKDENFDFNFNCEYDCDETDESFTNELENINNKGYEKGYQDGYKDGYEKAKQEVLDYMKKNKCSIKSKRSCSKRH